MKTLLILRHAKSDHGDASLSDHDRPLNERGKRDAPRVGERLLAVGLVPDLILSSTARRAKKTAEKVAAACEYKRDIQFASELYLAPAETYLSVLARLEGDLSRVMVVGHNPGLQELLSRVTRENRELPTAALAWVDFDIEAWESLPKSLPGKLVELWYPRDEL